MALHLHWRPAESSHKTNWASQICPLGYFGVQSLLLCPMSVNTTSTEPVSCGWESLPSLFAVVSMQGNLDCKCRYQHVSSYGWKWLPAESSSLLLPMHTEGALLIAMMLLLCECSCASWWLHLNYWKPYCITGTPRVTNTRLTYDSNVGR